MSSTVKAYIFDVYGTLFDVIGIKEECETLFPGHGEEISQRWRTKQVEYFLLRQMMGNYATLHTITRQALRYALNELGKESDEKAERQLLEAYRRLPLYPEAEGVLKQLEGKDLIVFSNGSHDMLDPLIEHAGLANVFARIISMDEIKQFKPAPSSYQYALEVLGVEKQEVLFMSSNGWDISGAKNFGFRTAWINRKNLPVEELGLPPDYIFSDLIGLLELD
ncbi:haloacid dehalogenase, type II [Planococcus salinarum]|uniref:Haloacid dehalogenase, type II n=1 Tax=Planococcus salinarum TaxID=622695 RepID=A0ABX3D161_9BACL|nr:haloacid dehalogenase type II [Planococcus salinarum]OHX51133.1 haloacid dehalogenase, type II [Planococcus salinarum]TAA73447.1 haloacid dehalogenase type II [Planococcus salinarum]